MSDADVVDTLLSVHEGDRIDEMRDVYLGGVE